MPPRGDKVKPKQQFSTEWLKRIRYLDKLLAAKGFDPYSRAGIIGNALHESGINPDSVNRYGYSGVWQNSKEIRRAIEDQYGDYSLLSLLRYLDDWTSGSTWVKKGKHRDHAALYSGSFKKTGYKSAQEASEAFLKLYERAVIKDKNGNVIGYLDWDKRNNYANQVYEWLHGTSQVPLESELVQQMKAKEWKPRPVLLPVVQLKQDYPIQVEAPQSLNAYNMPESPSYTTRLSDIQLFMNAVISDLYQPLYVPIQTTNQVLPVLNVILPDGNKTMKFSGFKNGKLPKYGDGSIPGLGSRKELSIEDAKKIADTTKKEVPLSGEDPLLKWLIPQRMIGKGIRIVKDIVLRQLKKEALQEYREARLNGHSREVSRFIATPDNLPLDFLNWESKIFDWGFKDGKLPSYSNGKIHIKPENRGKLTALKKRTGKS